MSDQTTITPGLVSITFRKLSVDEIIALLQRAGLRSVEWGGDVHVPHGDEALAREVQKKTVDAGLEVACYGSYYRAAVSPKQGLEFERVLASAVHLQAPSIRIWVGNVNPEDASEAFWAEVVEDVRRAAALAHEAGIQIAFEYHMNTLTNTCASTLRLLELLPEPNIFTLWQPPVGSEFGKNIQDISQLLPRILNLHVYQWAERERLPLVEGNQVWPKYFEAVSAGNPVKRHALLEFVQNDSPEQLIEDARVLREWVG